MTLATLSPAAPCPLIISSLTLRDMMWSVFRFLSWKLTALLEEVSYLIQKYHWCWIITFNRSCRWYFFTLTLPPQGLVHYCCRNWWQSEAEIRILRTGATHLETQITRGSVYGSLKMNMNIQQIFKFFFCIIQPFLQSMVFLQSEELNTPCNERSVMKVNIIWNFQHIMEL